jgi:CPA2 family monovalent cation:H+ antiporter-2
MHHDTDLINIVAVGLGLAFIFGALANKLRLSPLVG